MYDYKGKLAGKEVSFSFHYPETGTLYERTLFHASSLQEAIAVPSKEIDLFQKQWNVPDAFYVEYILSCSYACDFLMQHNCFVLHGASYLWHNRAYIFSAPSGTGKTTQLRLWKELSGEEVTVLNGDKPILEVCDTGKILVHPSPWKGKEGLGRDDITAPLGGIILLAQDKDNTIAKVSKSEAVKRLFGRIYSTFNTEKEVQQAIDLLNMVLESTNVWLLRNKGDMESAQLTRQILLKEEKRL